MRSPRLNVTNRPALLLSSIIVGAFLTGTVTLVLGRIHELLPHQPTKQKASWSVATVAFALAQAISAYGFSFVFAHTNGDYQLLFMMGAAAMVIALVLDLAWWLHSGTDD
ncbi:MAG: YbfB/YjiJ family MFS transporter [Hyphomicrobium sp.]